MYRVSRVDPCHAGRSPHGERGLKSKESVTCNMRKCRSPHGERGLKWRDCLILASVGKSRSPHGERGLKWSGTRAITHGHAGRSPHGERGLKYAEEGDFAAASPSLSSWRAWIEIGQRGRWRAHQGSLSSWRAWIEMQILEDLTGARAGRSPHGERGLKSTWKRRAASTWRRSPHGERGLKFFVIVLCLCATLVALLMESVD